MDRGQIGFDPVVGTLTNLLENMSMDSLPAIQSVLKLHRICSKKKEFRAGLGESFIAVKKYWKISQVVMVITSEILNLSRVAGGHE